MTPVKRHDSCVSLTPRPGRTTMPADVARNASQSCMESRTPRWRVSALTAALATAGLLTLGSAHAVPIADTTHEPTNNTLAGATPGNVGDTFTGCVGAFCL